MSYEIEPAHVLTALIAVGGAILAFMFKINRCIGRLESKYESLNERVKTIANSYLDHLDKKTR